MLGLKAVRQGLAGSRGSGITRRLGFMLGVVLLLVLATHGPAAASADTANESGNAAATAPDTATAAAAAKAKAEAKAKEEVAACKAARVALDGGKLTSAKAQYEELGEAKCAVGGLATVRSCELGDAYSARGKRSDASTAYKKALAEDPGAPCAINGVAKPVATFPASWATWITNALPVALTLIGASLLVLLAILLGGYIKPFGKLLAKTPGIRAILSPRLTIGPIDDSAAAAKPGAAITARIKERLQRFREETLRRNKPDYLLDCGTGDDQFAELVSGDGPFQTALNNARELSDQTKTIAALAGFIYSVLPVERLTVTGAVCTQDEKTAAGTFALERDAQLKAATTITGPATDTSTTSGASFVALSERAAAWVQYVVAQTLAAEPFTPDWADSYALVQLGLGYQLAGHADLAQKAYKSALALNSENWAAYVNLAVTEAWLGDGPAGAIPICVEGLRAMTETPT